MTLTHVRTPADGAPLVLAYHVGAVRILPHVPESWGLATGSPPFTDPSVIAEARKLAGHSPLVLVGWSAGCQAVRQLLRAGLEPLAVIALDGAHADWPALQPWQVETWADYALRGVLVVTATRQTYVETLPRGRYASTLRVAAMLLGEDPATIADGVYPLGRGQVEIHPSARIDGPAHMKEIAEHLPRILREIVVPAIEGAPAPVAQASPPSGLGQAALDVARAELAKGVREEPPGSNTGPEVRRYLAPCVRGGRSVGLSGGPWCAAFASWCTWSAWWPGDEFAVALSWPRSREGWGIGPQPPIGYRAAVHELVEDASACGAWRAPEAAETPRPGDLLVFGRAGATPTRGGLGHVAICEAWGAVKSCISGNDGDAVRRREWASESPWGPLLGWIRVG